MGPLGLEIYTVCSHHFPMKVSILEQSQCCVVEEVANTTRPPGTSTSHSLYSHPLGSLSLSTHSNTATSNPASSFGTHVNCGNHAAMSTDNTGNSHGQYGFMGHLSCWVYMHNVYVCVEVLCVVYNKLCIYLFKVYT